MKNVISILSITVLNIILMVVSTSNLSETNELLKEIENDKYVCIQVVQTEKQVLAQTFLKVYDKPLELSDEELKVVAGIITSETGGYYYDNSNVMPDRILVAQTIREEVEQTGKMPSELANNIRYAKPTYEGMSEQAKTAVDLVFNKGYGIVDCGIKYYYAPKICKSEFHESQNFILETKLHRYFN